MIFLILVFWCSVFSVFGAFMQQSTPFSLFSREGATRALLIVCAKQKMAFETLVGGSLRGRCGVGDKVSLVLFTSEN